MVFSNKYPDLKRLTKDRWLILHPNNDGLKDFTQQLQNKQERRCAKDFPQIMKGKSGDAPRSETDEVDHY